MSALSSMTPGNLMLGKRASAERVLCIFYGAVLTNLQACHDLPHIVVPPLPCRQSPTFSAPWECGGECRTKRHFPVYRRSKGGGEWPHVVAGTVFFLFFSHLSFKNTPFQLNYLLTTTTTMSTICDPFNTQTAVFCMGSYLQASDFDWSNLVS